MKSSNRGWICYGLASPTNTLLADFWGVFGLLLKKCFAYLTVKASYHLCASKSAHLLLM